MQKIEVVVRRSRIAEMREVFRAVGLPAMPVSDVSAPAGTSDRPVVYRGAPYAQDVPLGRVETVVDDADAQAFADAIGAAAHARGFVDGYVAVTPVTTMRGFRDAPAPPDRRDRKALRAALHRVR